MKLANNWKEYKIIDMADGKKLEQWGNIVLSRPDPQIIWKDKSFPNKWDKVNATYNRSKTGGGSWKYNKKTPDKWQIHYKNLTFNIKTMGFKHTGLFPEQAVNWDWMIEKIKNEKDKNKKEVKVTNEKKEKISIIVPCYNEQESLPIFYEEITKIAKEMKNQEFEFLFINDGSKDNTLKILKDLAKKDDRVRFISFSRNFGKEGGMYAGLENATGDYVAIMDADMQDPPSMIKTMYQDIKEEGFDCVALCSPSHKGYGIVRKFFTNCWYKLIGKISSTPQVPGARDFRLMKRKMVDAIVNMKEYNRYSKGIFSFVGFNTKWIEYEAPDRVAGTSKFNFWKLFKYALEGILAFSTTPLVMAAIIGLIFCLIAFIAIIVIIIKTLAFGDPVGGWPSLACMIMLVSGVQLFFLGIFGMYMSKLYLEVKKRPIYIPSETEKDVKEEEK